MTAVIIGAGLAGLTAALAMAPRPVVVLSRGALGDMTSSNLAQGGIAAALAADDDPARHAADTLTAGAGLCDPAVVVSVTREGPAAIAQLLAWGTAFDRNPQDNSLSLGLEGAHCCRRVAHVDGDGTGAGIMRALIARVREAKHIRLYENAVATELRQDAVGYVDGVFFLHDGQTYFCATPHVLLATGGAGALWQNTTAPLESWGHGLALAAHAGARLRDLEFMQFHPTALDGGLDPMPLVSEAVRGEGATLIDETGHRFIDNELAPRDVVARAIWAQLGAGHRVFLDARSILSFATHFPAINRFCAAAGIDPAHDPIPVRPVAHYHMGGVWVDENGQSTVPGLYALGEVSSTGLHGANRLASNSLLEAVVYGLRVAAVLPADAQDDAPQETAEGAVAWTSDEDRAALRALMTTHVGVLRSAEGLQTALEKLRPLARQSPMGLVGLLIAAAALHRQESRGAHTRTDYPLCADVAQSTLIDPLPFMVEQGIL